MKTTLTPTEKEKTIITYNPSVLKKDSADVEILRIEFEDDFTRIDFLYRASSYYVNGGWIQISKQTYIRAVGSELKLSLIKAVNIPIAPHKHYFKSSCDMLAYTLYFPKVPKDCESIDIIEGDSGTNKWFNFYGVSMNKVRNEVLICKN
jgi:hypothetical protein